MASPHPEQKSGRSAAPDFEGLLPFAHLFFLC